ncbi:MAG: molybdopterin molybdotransferase MoeA [Actinobacteria bacterium]|nr:molybdopterin molybdotransferase MoeA [Actinomycetota bacterium]
MLSFKEAQEKVLECQVYLKTVKVPILESLGRIIASDIVANDFIPSFDNSTADGFAVKYVDIIGADRNYPVKLKLLKDNISAGKIPQIAIESGFAVQIVTGAPVPEGCDCVVMREDTLKEGKDVLIFKECGQGENIRTRGEDIKKGDVMLRAGKKIYPADIAVMAAAGIIEIEIFRPPTVGIISNGDELININEELKESLVRDCNSYSLCAQVIETGSYCKMYGIVGDSKNLIKEKVSEALKNCDMLLISGGVSVGDNDYVREILADIGAEFIFWRVNQHPGKSLAFLTFEEKFIFALPGNPASVMVCFEMYARPLIKRIMGDTKYFKDIMAAKASREYTHESGRTDFVRVSLEEIDGMKYFNSTGIQGSGVLSSMAEADGLAILNEDKSIINKEDYIDVYLIK